MARPVSELMLTAQMNVRLAVADLELLRLIRDRTGEGQMALFRRLIREEAGRLGLVETGE